MSARCCQPSTPHIIKVCDRPILPSSTEAAAAANLSARLLDEPHCAVPTLAGKESKILISELRDRQEELFRQVLDQQVIRELRERQEELFRQVLDQQREFQNQLLAMHLIVKDNIDSQSDWKKCQDDFIVEFRDFSSKLSMAEQVLKPDGKRRSLQEITEESTQGETAEFADNKKLAVQKESAAAAAAAEGDPERHVPMSPSAGSKLSTTEEVTADFMDHVKNKRPSETLGDQASPENLNKARRLQEYVSKLMRRKEFEIAVAVAILMNAFVMCWESQYHGLDVGFHLQYPGRQARAKVVWAGAETAFTFFDWLFGILFFLEMLVKLVCWRWTYFYERPGKSPHKIQNILQGRSELWRHVSCCRFFCGIQGWNLLDFFCVVTFVASKMAAAGAVNPQTLRLLRLFRLGRLVRLLRFFETLDHLYVMTTAISGLQHVLAWTIVLLTLILLTCDLFLVQILHDTYFDQIRASDLTEEELRRYHQMYEYFGTCTRCMLSMFEITLGDWQDIARLLTEEVSQWFTLICVVHKLTIGFAVVGVITGVILQETFKVADTDDIIMFRKKRLAGHIIRKKMSALFAALDESHDGKVHLSEFEGICVIPEIKIWLGSLGIETDDLKTLFSLIDIDDNGYITLDELVARMPRIQGTARSLDVLALQRRVGHRQSVVA